MRNGVKLFHKKITAIVLAIVFPLTMVACAGKQVPLNTAADTIRRNTQDPYKHKYTVTFKSGERYSFDDKEISVKGDLIGLRFEDKDRYDYYRLDQLQQIRIKRKTHWLTGAGIGAGVGALGAGLGFALGAKCTGTSGNCEETALHAFGIAGFALLGAGVGFGIGAGIGAAVPKKKKVEMSVSPQVYHQDGYKVSGAGIGVSGSF